MAVLVLAKLMYSEHMEVVVLQVLDVMLLDSYYIQECLSLD